MKLVRLVKNKWHGIFVFREHKTNDMVYLFRGHKTNNMVLCI